MSQLNSTLPSLRPLPPPCPSLFPLSPSPLAEPNFFCYRNFAPLCMPPLALHPSDGGRRRTDGGAVNWQKPVILMTINNSGGRQPTRRIFILCPRYGAEQAKAGSVTGCREFHPDSPWQLDTSLYPYSFSLFPSVHKWHEFIFV